MEYRHTPPPWAGGPPPRRRSWKGWVIAAVVVLLVAPPILRSYLGGAWWLGLVGALVVVGVGRAAIRRAGSPARDARPAAAADDGQAQPPGTPAVLAGTPVGWPPGRAPLYAAGRRLAPSEAHPSVLVIGPTGSGKTRRLLGRMVATWPGPVLAVSSKPDLAAGTIAHRLAWTRWAGTADTVAVWDPTDLVRCPTTATAWAAAAVRATWDPTMPLGLETAGPLGIDDDAIRTADALAAQVGGVGGGDGPGTSFWAAQASEVLAPVLAWAWIEHGRAGAAYDALAPDAEALGAAVEVLAAAGLDVLARPLAAALDALAGEGSRRADSAFATARAALAPWRAPSLRRRDLPDLDLAAWAASKVGAAFVVVPAHDAARYAPAVCGLVEQAVAALRRREGGEHALLVLDEAANVSPLPNLGTWATELRGWGGRLVCALQTTRQAVRWDERDPVGWALGSWSRVLVAAGAAEGEIARHLEQAHGRVLEQRWTRSASESSGLSQAKREGLVLPGWHPPTHQSGTSTSWSEAWAEVPALPASEALAPEPGRGENQWVVIEGGRRVGTVAPNDITEVDRWLDAATAAWVAAGAGPGAGEQP